MAQARCYGYIYGLQEALNEVTLQLQPTVIWRRRRSAAFRRSRRWTNFPNGLLV
ncbi:MAG: hypothetical protein ACLR8P_15030 [Clostridium fessum]